ncbi:MAG TPA: hypothetical protein VFY54_00730 [Rubrobacter sp.]|nr:hypothetical protein [Rubrobacter sp.]
MNPYEQVMTDDEVREIGFESTRKGWVPFEVAKEHRQTGLTPGQWRRFSFVTARGYAALPDAGLRAFDLAACLGKMMTKEGTFDRIRNVSDSLCVIVRPNIRDRVLGLLGLTPRTWQKYVAGWIGAGMACRCPSQPRGTITLFFEPQDRCPVCVLSERSVRSVANAPFASYEGSVRQNVPIPGDASRDGKGDEG